MAHSLLNRKLQRVIVGNSLGFVKHRIRAVTDKRRSKVGIASGRGIELLRRNARHLITVRRGFSVDGIGSSSDQRLIERDWNREMLRMISHISQGHRDRIKWLPLQIELPIFRIGQLIGRIISTKKKRIIPADKTSAILYQRDHATEVSGRSRRRCRTKWR